MRLVFAMLTLAGVCAVAGPAHALQKCQPGAYGTGGIYDEAKLKCVDGKLLRKDQEWCPPGVNGKGGVYLSSGAYCDKGRPLQNDEAWCGGARGGPYNPKEERCVDGKLVAAARDYCQAGVNGRGGRYDKNISKCEGGRILAKSQQWCPAGPNGAGGAYVPGYARCDRGRVVRN